MRLLVLVLVLGCFFTKSLQAQPKLIPFLQGEKWGFVNNQKQVVIPCKYGNNTFGYVVKPFAKEGVMVVYKDDLRSFDPKSPIFSYLPQAALINEEGEWLTDFAQARAIAPFSEGLAMLIDDDPEFTSFIDKTGKVALKIPYKAHPPIEYLLGPMEESFDNFKFSEGLVAVYNTTKNSWKEAWTTESPVFKGYADKTGKLVVPFQYLEAQPFREGWAAVYDSQYAANFVDAKGKTLLPDFLPNSFVESFQNGLAIVRDYRTGQSRNGMIDTKGKYVIPVEYESLSSCDQKGRIVAQKNGKWGVIDKQNQVLVPFIYDSVSFGAGMMPSENQPVNFQEDLLPVVLNGQLGFIDDQNRTIIPFKYEQSYGSGFSEGVAPVSREGKYGFIDRQNQVVIPFEYDFAEAFKNGLARVSAEGLTGFYIDRKNTRYVDPNIYLEEGNNMALVSAKSGLNLRAKPDPKAEVLANIPNNTLLQLKTVTNESIIIDGVDGYWVEAAYKDKTGYVFSGLLKSDPLQVNAQGGVSLREQPSKESKRLTTLPDKAIVFLLESLTDTYQDIDGKAGHWFKVWYEGKEGYAFSPYFIRKPICNRLRRY